MSEFDRSHHGNGTSSFLKNDGDCTVSFTPFGRSIETVRRLCAGKRRSRTKRKAATLPALASLSAVRATRRVVIHQPKGLSSLPNALDVSLRATF